MVIMALATTFMTTPILARIYRPELEQEVTAPTASHRPPATAS
jgi:hypothetical protein